MAGGLLTVSVAGSWLVSSALLVVAVLVGAFVGYLLTPEPAPQVVDPATSSVNRRTEVVRTASLPAVTTTEVGRRVSSANLRPVRISSHTAPMSPPGLELRLMISDYDVINRTPLAEGWYERQSFGELTKRVRDEVLAKAPVQNLLEVLLVSWRSLGPVGLDGRCELGWHFVYEEGSHGLRASAVLTPVDIVTSYVGIATWHRPEAGADIDPAAVVQALVGSTGGALPWLHVTRPEQVLAWTVADAPLRRAAGELWEWSPHAGVRPPSASARAARAIIGESTTAPGERPIPTVESVLPSWVALLRRADEGIPTMDETAAHRLADEWLGQVGALGCLTLEQWFMAHDDGDQRLAILEVLARVPSALAVTCLYRLRSQARRPTVRERLDQLLRRRRRYDRIRLESPLDRLNFAEIRTWLDDSPILRMPLRASFNPMTELVEPLGRLGLVRLHATVLAGASETPMTVRFRSEADPHTHVLMASTPLPMPCHVLHIHGESRQQIHDQVMNSGLVYSLRQIQDDAHSGKPNLVYRAALYLAAVGAAPRKGAAPLLDAWPRAAADPHMQRALLRAMEFAPEPEVLELMQAQTRGAAELAPTAIQVVEAWQKRGILPAAPLAPAQSSEI
jgi:hypothetical protein